MKGPSDSSRPAASHIRGAAAGATMVPGDNGGGVPCDYCATQRALLHCAQHGTGLRPLGHAATAHAHERACETCHATPARCADHRASLCTPCARAAWCNAERHARCRLKRSYTGFPDPADLASSIPYIDAPPELPPPPPTTALQEPKWLPDVVNVELQAADFPGCSSRSFDEQDTIMNEVPSGSLIQTGGNFESQVAAGGLAAAVLLPTGCGEGDAGLFTQDDFDWSLDDAAGAGSLDDFNFNSDDLSFTAQDPNLTNSFNVEVSSWLSPSGYDNPWPLKPSSSYSSEMITSDHGTESLAGNNAAFWLSNSAMCTAANTSTSVTPYMYERVPVHQLPQQCNFFNSGLPLWPPDEFPSRHMLLMPAALGGSPPAVVHQDQDAPLQQAAASVPEQASRASQDMEARTKLQEKRQEAKQRYKEKKKNKKAGSGGQGKNKRKCRKCNQVADHDARNCPNNVVG